MPPLSVVAGLLSGDHATERRQHALIATGVGAGESRPVASNNTDGDRAQNRRVEITLVPVRS